jgi:hypothetical protein
MFETPTLATIPRFPVDELPLFPTKTIPNLSLRQVEYLIALIRCGDNANNMHLFNTKRQQIDRLYDFWLRAQKLGNSDLQLQYLKAAANLLSPAREASPNPEPIFPFQSSLPNEAVNYGYRWDLSAEFSSRQRKFFVQPVLELYAATNAAPHLSLNSPEAEVNRCLIELERVIHAFKKYTIPTIALVADWLAEIHAFLAKKQKNNKTLHFVALPALKEILNVVEKYEPDDSPPRYRYPASIVRSVNLLFFSYLESAINIEIAKCSNISKKEALKAYARELLNTTTLFEPVKATEAMMALFKPKTLISKNFPNSKNNIQDIFSLMQKFIDSFNHTRPSSTFDEFDDYFDAKPEIPPLHKKSAVIDAKNPAFHGSNSKYSLFQTGPFHIAYLIIALLPVTIYTEQHKTALRPKLAEAICQAINYTQYPMSLKDQEKFRQLLTEHLSALRRSDDVFHLRDIIVAALLPTSFSGLIWPELRKPYGLAPASPVLASAMISHPAMNPSFTVTTASSTTNSYDEKSFKGKQERKIASSETPPASPIKTAVPTVVGYSTAGLLNTAASRTSGTSTPSSPQSSLSSANNSPAPSAPPSPDMGYTDTAIALPPSAAAVQANKQAATEEPAFPPGGATFYQ